MDSHLIKNRITLYLSGKINNPDIEHLDIQDCETYLYFRLSDFSKNKICFAIYYIKIENRIIFCFEDVENIEILDEYNGSIDFNLEYIDVVISNEIIRTEEFCKKKLNKKYFEFYQIINRKVGKVKLYSVNKFSLFCKLDKRITIFKPW